jgi:hypothetical protein
VNPRTVTWALGALALALAVVLTVVLLQRPSTGPSTANPQATSPQTETTAEPAASPTAEVTDLASEGGPSPLPSSEVEGHDASPGATPYSQTDEARRDWQPVATGFGKAFTTTKGKDAAGWRASLAPFVTDKVKDQLATVALANVPDGTFDRIEPAEYGEDKIAVFVHYDTGLTLVTYLILDGTNWRIYAYDRWED